MSDITTHHSVHTMHEKISLYNMVLSSDFGSWQWEPKTDALYFNAQYMRMLGYAEKQFPYHISTWENLLHPDDKEEARQTLHRVRSTPSSEDSIELRFRQRAASGDYVWILGKGSVITRDEDGKAERVSGMHFSLTALNQAAEEQALQNDRMRFALEAGGDGLWDWDTESEEVYFSPQYISMLGYKPDDFPQHVDSWSSRVHSEDYAATVAVQYTYIATPSYGDNFECVYRFRGADGVYRWILGRGKVIRRDAQGKGTRIVGLHTDITELRNVQESLTHILHHDSLTRLCSRYYFDVTLEELQPEHFPISIIYADVDGLRLINDNLGHAAGDKVLEGVAEVLRKSMPEDAIIGRMSGDEFAILLRACPAERANQLMKNLQLDLDLHNTDPQNIPLFMAFGLVTAETKTPVHKLMARADMDMLEHKRQQHGQKIAIIAAWIENKCGHPISREDTWSKS